MLIYLVLGITYGFAAGIMPGPLSTYLVSRTLEARWRRTLPEGNPRSGSFRAPTKRLTPCPE
jgi:hypothetical protein